VASGQLTSVRGLRWTACFAGSGSPSNRTRLRTCSSLEVALTIRGRSVSFGPGSAPTLRVSTTWPGFDGLAASNATCAATQRAGGWATGESSALRALAERR
jgi:hypothetical protein